MSTVSISLGRANWYVSEPDWSVAQAKELSGKRQSYMKARVILSLPHISSKLRLTAHALLAANVIVGVIILGSFANA